MLNGSNLWVQKGRLPLLNKLYGLMVNTVYVIISVLKSISKMVSCHLKEHRQIYCFHIYSSKLIKVCLDIKDFVFFGCFLRVSLLLWWVVFPTRAQSGVTQIVAQIVALLSLCRESVNSVTSAASRFCPRKYASELNEEEKNKCPCKKFIYGTLSLYKAPIEDSL